MKLKYLLKTDTSPVFLRKIHDMFSVMDVHDHGDTKVSNESIEIDENLNFNSWAGGDLGSLGVVNFNQSIGELSTFFKDNECYLHPYGGDPFPLTILGSFNATLVGAIIGDYSSSEASFSYSSITKSYSFEDVINVEYSDIYIKSIVVHSVEVENPLGVVLTAPEGMTEDVTLTMPEDLPDASSLILASTGGVLSYYPNTPLPANSFVVVDNFGAITTINIDFSFIDIEDPYRVFQFKEDGLSVGVNTTEGVVLACGESASRPVTPIESMVRANTTLSTLEVYDGLSWKSITMVSGDGLALSDLTDTEVIDRSPNQFLQFDGLKWVNYTRPAVGWADILSTPSDITDLSLYSFSALSDCTKPAVVPDGFVLGIVNGKLTPTMDAGTTAVWGNLTGDIANQDLGITMIGGVEYDFTSASIQKRLSGWIALNEEKLYESKIKMVITEDEEVLEESITAGPIGLAVVNDFATTSTSILEFSKMPTGETPVVGQILKMTASGNFVLVDGVTGESAPVFNKKDSIYTHDGIEGKALLAPDSSFNTFILEASPASDLGLKWVEAGGVENSPVTTVYSLDSTTFGTGSIFSQHSGGAISGALFSISSDHQDMIYGRLGVYIGATLKKYLYPDMTSVQVLNLGAEALSIKAEVEPDVRVSQFSEAFHQTSETGLDLLPWVKETIPESTAVKVGSLGYLSNRYSVNSDGTLLGTYRHYSGSYDNGMGLGLHTLDLISETATHTPNTWYNNTTCMPMLSTFSDGVFCNGGIGSNMPLFYDKESDIWLMLTLNNFGNTGSWLATSNLSPYFLIGVGFDSIKNIAKGDEYTPPDGFTRGWVHNYTEAYESWFTDPTKCWPTLTFNEAFDFFYTDTTPDAEVDVRSYMTSQIPEIHNFLAIGSGEGLSMIRVVNNSLVLFRGVERLEIDLTILGSPTYIVTSFETEVQSLLPVGAVCNSVLYVDGIVKNTLPNTCGFLTYTTEDKVYLQSFTSGVFNLAENLTFISDPVDLGISILGKADTSGIPYPTNRPWFFTGFYRDVSENLHLIMQTIPYGFGNSEFTGVADIIINPAPYTGISKITVVEVQQ